MNRKALLSLFVLMNVGCTSSISLQEETTSNEMRLVHFAERVAVIETARVHSPLVREIRERSWGACPRNDAAIELAIGAMSVSESNAAADALVNLLGLELDGAASEALNCQLFIRGRTVSERLARAPAKAIAEHCQSALHELQKRELEGTNMEAERVCRAEDEIRQRQNAMLEAIKLNPFSVWEECFHQVSGGDQLPAFVQNVAAATAAANEARQVHFAENIIISETAEELKRSIPLAREAGKQEPCPETRTLELAIGTIGIAKSEAAVDALVNLLGFRLNDTGFRELRCQIASRSDSFSARLENTQPKAIVEHCRSAFHELQKSQLRNANVEVDQLCRPEAEVLDTRNGMLDAIQSKAPCVPL